MRRRLRAKSMICATVAAAMAFSLVPVSAASALGSQMSWIAPSSITATTTGEGDSVQSYITSSGHKVTESTADILGISNITVFPNAGNPFTYQGTAEEIFNSVSSTARFGIYGSEVNQNMNPYYANYFYNAAQNYNGGTNLADESDTILITTTASGGPNAADTAVVDAYGTSSSLYRRPDMLYGVGTVTSKKTGATKSYGDELTSTSGYSALVQKIRNKELGEYDGISLYQEGDENYDPYYVNYSMSNGTYGATTNLYSLAGAAEAIMADDSSKTTRYESPMEIAQNFEEYLLASQYAVLKAIDEGMARKTIAIIDSVNTETKSFKLIDDAASKATSTGNQISDGIEATTDNIIDVNKIEDLATATAKDIMACDVVYINGYAGMSSGSAAQEKVAENIIAVLKDSGYTDESAYPQICIAGPKTVIHNTRQGSPECTPAAIDALGFAYPEVVNPVYALAYFYENFYHVKTSSLADALGLNLASMTLPKGVELNIDEYDAADYESVLEEGLAYYYENEEAIDAAYPKLDASSNIENRIVQAGLEKAAADAEAAAQAEIDAAKTAAQAEIDAAKDAQAKAEKAAADTAASIKTVTINKATVKNSDVKKYTAATTVVLGAKVKKISANTFKGTKVKSVIIQSKKLKKAKVKNCFKSSKVKNVQVPASKQKAYKKFLTKKVTGKKVKFV